MEDAWKCYYYGEFQKLVCAKCCFLAIKSNLRPYRIFDHPAYAPATPLFESWEKMKIKYSLHPRKNMIQIGGRRGFSLKFKNDLRAESILYCLK